MSVTAALRGYRTQFLYSLHKILATLGDGFSYRPEGYEDLDIYNEQGKLVEVIQVKNLKSGVLISDILSSNKTSFIKRGLQLISKTESVKLTLVSFTSISTEITDIIRSANPTKESKIIKDYHLIPNQWQSLKKQFSTEIVNEDILYAECLSNFKSLFELVDPEVTLELLLYWIALCAEKGEVITRASLIKRAEASNEYIKEKASVIATSGTYLKPLHLPKATLVGDRLLADEYYSGISARHEHIIAGLDVPRGEALQQLTAAFYASNIVVLHGASGQGKSSLAYRYIQDQRSSQLVYELILQDDYTITSQVIRSVQSISRGLNMAVLFLINVMPATVHWVRIVREFAAAANINFLITVREDDWHRSIVAGIEFSHADVELGLLKEEAKLIFEQMAHQRKSHPYTDFEEAWIHFGGKGPLLEFVYLITHGDSLKNRLKQQVIQLAREDAPGELVRLLRLIALIDSKNSRTSIERLKGFPHLLFQLQKLEKEYLVKVSTDGQYITGLHPVRSLLLTELLFDEVVEKRSDYLIAASDITYDEDWFYFLIQAFYDGDLQGETIFKELLSLYINWVRYAAAVKALLWKGLFDFVKVNYSFFDQSYKEFSAAWYVFLDIWFTPRIDLSALTDMISLERLQNADDIKGRLTPKESVFNDAARFMNDCPLPTSFPEENKAVASFGDLLFWRANIPGVHEKVLLLPVDFEGRKFTLEAIAHLIFGLSYHFKPEKLHALQHQFVPLLRERYLIPHFEINEEQVTAHFIFSFEERIDHDKVKPHDVSIEIADFVRMAFPNKEYYATKGYGHRLKTVELPYDDAEKRIQKDYMHPEGLVFLNSTMAHLFDYTKRPSDWTGFQKGLIEWEQNIADYLSRLQEALQSYFKQGSYVQLGHVVDNYSVRPLWHTPVLPQSVSDRLGIYSGANSSKSQSQKTPAEGKAQKFYSRYDVMVKSCRDFHRSIENFVRQSHASIYHILKKINGKTERDDHIKRLSTFNLFEAIKAFRHYREQQAQLLGTPNSNGSLINLVNLHSMAFAWSGFLSTRSIKGSIANQASLYFEEVEKKFLKKLQSELRKIKEAKVVLKMNLSPRGQPFIFLDAKDFMGYLSTLPQVYTAIREAIGNPEDLGLKKLLLDLTYSSFYIIPIVEGLTMNQTWHEYPLLALTKYEYTALPLLYQGAKPMPSDIQEALHFTSWESLGNGMREARALIENLMAVKITVEHLLDVCQTEKLSLDETGRKLLSEYGQETGKKIETALQNSWDNLSFLGDQFRGDKGEDKGTEELYLELWHRISGVQLNLFPVDTNGESNLSFQVNGKVVENWWPRLNVCVEEAGLLYFVVGQLLVKDIQKTGTKTPLFG